MNIIYGGDNETSQKFAKLSHGLSMKGPLWLVLLDPDSVKEEFLADANLPFDIDLVTLQLSSENRNVFILHEAYRVSEDKPLKIVYFGNWTLDDGLYSPSHVSLYYRRNDMEGLPLRVATSESFPVVYRSFDEDGKYNISGYFATVWHEVESRLNFTSEYLFQFENLTSGSILKNGSWSGVTGVVSRKEAQVGIAPLTCTGERSNVVEFLRPLLTTRNNLFFKKPGLEIRWGAIFRPFGVYIWTSILLWIIFGSLIFTLVFKVSYYVIGSESRSRVEDFTPVNSFFCFLRAFTQQGSPAVPHALPGRIVILSTYLTALIMIAAYSGALISFIAVQEPRLPFKSLSELVKDGSYRILVNRGTASFRYFEGAADPILTAAYNLIHENLPYSSEESIERVCNDYKLVHFGPTAELELLIQQLNDRGCEILSLPTPMNRVYQSIIMEQGNHYKDAINHQVSHGDSQPIFLKQRNTPPQNCLHSAAYLSRQKGKDATVAKKDEFQPYDDIKTSVTADVVFSLDMMVYQGILGRIKRTVWHRHEPLPIPQIIEVGHEQVIPIYLVLLAGCCLACMIFALEKIKGRILKPNIPIYKIKV